MKTALALAAVSAFATVSLPAFAATNFSVDTSTPTSTSIKVTDNDTLCFGNCNLTATLASPFSDFSLNVGESQTFNFANIRVGRGIGVGSATVDAVLSFLPPVGGSASSNGSANYFRFGGLLFGGTLVWDGPQSVTGADGSNYTVAFGDLLGIQFGSNVAVPVTVTLNSVGAVPEPATWAMLLIGFGAVGASMRYRRKQTVRVSYA